MGSEYDFAKVLDFCLVKILNENETQMTVEGATTGTPAYMAPYWLTTGSLVFEEKSAAAMMLAHLQNVPIAPSMRNDLAIPACLDRAIMMCLAKKPTERPASAEAFAGLLESCEDIGSWTPEDAKRWWHANIVDAGVRADDKVASMSVNPDALTTL